MANLEKRVQVLFSAEQYARLEAEARAEGLSVGAAIRQAVEWWMNSKRADAESVWGKVFDRADALPPQGPLDWEAEKDAFERDVLGDAHPVRPAA